MWGTRLLLGYGPKFGGGFARRVPGVFWFSLILCSLCGWCVHGGDYRFQGVYPDVVAVRDAPVFIAEVVTWGTAGADLGEKARSYRASPTVRQCAYVSVDRAWVEIHTRDEGGRWVVEDVTGLEATCVFTGIDCSVGMAAIYEGALAR